MHDVQKAAGYYWFVYFVLLTIMATFFGLNLILAILNSHFAGMAREGSLTGASSRNKPFSRVRKKKKGDGPEPLSRCLPPPWCCCFRRPAHHLLTRSPPTRPAIVKALSLNSVPRRATV